MFDKIGEFVVDFLFFSFDDGDSFDVGLLFGFFDDIKCSLFGLVLDGLLHFLDSLFNAAYDHGFE